MDKKTILLGVAGIAGLLIVARMSGKKESEVEASDIPEGPKPGKKKEGQKTLRGQTLNFFKELKDLGYFNSDMEYTAIIDEVVATPDKTLKKELEKSLGSLLIDIEKWYGKEGVFKASSTKDVQEAVKRFITANNLKLNLTNASDSTAETTGRFMFGRGRRFGNRMPLWRQLRPLRRKRCPYAVSEENNPLF